MSKNTCFREPFEKQHVKRAQGQFKYASQQLYHINWSLPSQLNWKIFRLLTCQIVGLLVKTLATDEKYPILNRENLRIPIQMQLSQKQKNFSQFFTAFLKSKSNFEYFYIKMTLTAFAFPKLQTPNTWLDKSLKSPVAPLSLLKSASQTVYNIHWPLPSQISWKKSLLLRCKILGLLVNTLASDEKYLVLHSDNLTIPIQMQLCQKKENISQIFAAFLKSRFKFKHFEKRVDSHTFFIFEVTVSENVVR